MASPARRVASGPVEGQPASRQAQPGAQQKPAFSAQDVADTPQLADGIVLSGQMEESAFVEEPALVQKDGRFIQLTELLFQIVKHIDGKTSIDDVAAAVSKDSGKEITADEVRTLIAEKLIPVGIVPTADGKVPESKTARSPLALNMKMAMVSPALLKSVTWLLQGLFFPLVLVPVLALAFAVLGWVFLIHGIAASVHDAFYTPGLLLLTFGIIVFSAAFHELGHASGLRAGGKLPRAMGAGLYLVYPAFYTDVSENYQLKRWARVRTDLGGFYFNLIFAIAMVAVYLATGWEYLLFIVALICLEIIHQLLPFVRLDGYWALADMLGIPDFFSQITAFVRSIIPFHLGGGRKMPRLRWWAKVAFGLYIVIVVPLLAVMVFLMIKGFPRVVATAFDAAGKLFGQMGEALGKGDFLLVAAIVLQLVFIALPTIGIAIILF
ncbi:MAG: putative peptide zinc metalloprotease protein, partial [Chloroflexota bacterium]|nr:putative peptide zinc metalloprotease protein [Chloroflexota bacterium]